VSGSRSTETKRADPVEGHEAGWDRNPRIPDQTKAMAVIVVAAASMALPHLLLSKLMRLLLIVTTVCCILWFFVKNYGCDPDPCLSPHFPGPAISHLPPF